jgi:hypothetical protein
VRVCDIDKSCALLTLTRQKKRVQTTKFRRPYFHFCVSNLFGHAHSETFILHYHRTYVPSVASSITFRITIDGEGQSCCAGMIFANPVLDLLFKTNATSAKKDIQSAPACTLRFFVVLHIAFLCGDNIFSNGGTRNCGIRRRNVVKFCKNLY